MRQSRKPLTADELLGKAPFLSMCKHPECIERASHQGIRQAAAYADTLLVMPDGGRKAKDAIKAELRRRKL